jgi:ABC-type polysaccharide/polyol phosphate transport system ATPase subunit
VPGHEGFVATLGGMIDPESGRPVALVARGVSKAFRMPEERTSTLKERVLHPRRRTGHETLQALEDISVSVVPGEFFGIVGRNGSGKSTLLKCMAGIYGIDAGNIWVDGRLSTFIELGVGFNPDLAARDNVVMNGIMLGLSPREARARYDEVIGFAELEEFQELKLKNYSSGMHVRLAFSVAIQVDADILLIDEVLAVGDAAFQQKCFDVFQQMRDAGKTIVFVTHDMSAVNRFCHRAMLLERGRAVMTGEPQEVTDRYLEINFGRVEEPGQTESSRMGDGDARVVEAWIEDAAGKRLASAPQGTRLALRARVTFAREVEDPVASCYVLNSDHVAVLVATTAQEHERSGRFCAGEEVIFSFAFENVFAPGRYNPVFTMAHRGTGLDLMDRFEGAFSFVVTGAGALGGMIDLPVRTAAERVSRREPADRLSA